MKSLITDTFFRVLTAPVMAAGETFKHEAIPGYLKIMLRKSPLLNFSNKYPGSHQPPGYLQQLSFMFLTVFLMIPANAFCDDSDWSIGGYAGQYYDSEPAGIVNGHADFLNQYIVALTANRTVWSTQALPLSLEVDGMIGYQFGLASLGEIAIAPVFRWSSFPWKDTLQTDFRVGPLGISYTTSLSPLERGTNDRGSQTLNFFLVELAFSLPQKKSEEVFLRLHHRCSLYDVLNNYGANGEDFLAVGFRQHY